MQPRIYLATRARRGDGRGIIFGALALLGGAARTAGNGDDAVVRVLVRGVLPILVAALLASFSGHDARAKDLWVTPAGGVPGFGDAGQKMADKTTNFADAWLAAKPGDVIHLLADNADPARITPYGRLVLDLGGKTEDKPRDKSKRFEKENVIVLRGIGPRTRIVGKSFEEILDCPLPMDPLKYVHCETSDVAKTPAFEGTPKTGVSKKVDPLDAVFAAVEPDGGPANILAVPTHRPHALLNAACIEVTRVDGLVIENVLFENCSVAAVRAIGSRRLALRDSTIIGGSFGLAVNGKEKDPADEIVVEDVVWVQDTSGYARLGAPDDWTCIGGAPGIAGCPGRMWHTIPWGASHHGTHEYFNGALLGGSNTDSVTFRRNTILAAYNGIRLKAKDCKGKLDKCEIGKGVRIYDNHFAYIRDNPIELEVYASGARIFGNTIRNAHAWFSVDEMAGGPVYIYGNRGWFDDAPARSATETRPGLCIHDPDVHPADAPAGGYDSSLDRGFDYENRLWRAVGVEEYDNGKTNWWPPSEQICERGRVGRVVKTTLPPKTWPDDKPFPYAKHGIYVFNNSWYLRAPVLSTGAAPNIIHKNNAIEFCDSASVPDPLCDAERDVPPPHDCNDEFKAGKGLERYPAASGRTPFFDCFRWLPYDEKLQDVKKLESDFDHDISSNGFPKVATKKKKFEPNGRWKLPGFRSARTGDFRLVVGAEAATSTCKIVSKPDGTVLCDPGTTKGDHTGAYSADGRLYRGPPGMTDLRDELPKYWLPPEPAAAAP